MRPMGRANVNFSVDPCVVTPFPIPPIISRSRIQAASHRLRQRANCLASPNRQAKQGQRDASSSLRTNDLPADGARWRDWGAVRSLFGILTDALRRESQARRYEGYGSLQSSDYTRSRSSSSASESASSDFALSGIWPVSPSPV